MNAEGKPQIWSLTPTCGASRMGEEIILQAVVLGQLMFRKGEENSFVSFLIEHLLCTRDVLGTQVTAREIVYWVKSTF